MPSLGCSERAGAFEVVGNPGRAQRVIADFGFDAGAARAAFDHAVRVGLRHAVQRSPSARGSEQWRILLAGDAGRGDVLIQKTSSLW